MNINTGFPQPFPLKKKLPTTLSGWIYEAVRDAKRLSKTPGYTLNMSYFNSVFSHEAPTCHVCLGGAAILGCGLVQPGHGYGSMDGSMDNHNTRRIAFALDSVRTGNLEEALIILDIEPSKRKLPTIRRLERELNEAYSSKLGGRAPWRAYLKAARELKAIGL